MQTDTREEVAVVRIEALDEPAKDKASGGYSWPIRFVLVNGKTENSMEYRRLLREAKAAHAEMPHDVDNIAVCYRNGQMIGTRTSYRLGG